jgi:hypothetical protein
MFNCFYVDKNLHLALNMASLSHPRQSEKSDHQVGKVGSLPYLDIPDRRQY